jgi:PIN domain nuclease of toxin-antitoxin system
LDTHIWIWLIFNSERLLRGTRALLDDPDNQLWLSPISVWELFNLYERKRVLIDQSPEIWIAEAARKTGVIEAPVTTDVALAAGRLNMDHRDPADRFLVATANVYGLTLVTADRALLDARACALLPNR